MTYERDIKKLVKEKNRIQKIIDELGTSPWSIRHMSQASKLAEAHLRLAIEEIHRAEFELRKDEWGLL